MNAMMKAVAYAAKDRLIEKVEGYVKEREMKGGVSDQLNAMAGRESLEEISNLNRVEAYKLEKAIMNAEYYDPAKDKFNFGPRSISPVDYPAFLES